MAFTCRCIRAPSAQPGTTLLDSRLTVPLTVLRGWPQVSVLQTRGCVSLHIFKLHVLHPKTGLHCEGQLPRLLSGVLRRRHVHLLHGCSVCQCGTRPRAAHPFSCLQTFIPLARFQHNFLPPQCCCGCASQCGYLCGVCCCPRACLSRRTGDAELLQCGCRSCSPHPISPPTLGVTRLSQWWV